QISPDDAKTILKFAAYQAARGDSTRVMGFFKVFNSLYQTVMARAANGDLPLMASGYYRTRVTTTSPLQIRAGNQFFTVQRPSTLDRLELVDQVNTHVKVILPVNTYVNLLG